MICKYSDVPVHDGWVINKTYLPISFDLVELRRKNNPKIVTGWWNGRKWIGLHVKKGDIVTAWKRIINYDYYTT